MRKRRFSLPSTQWRRGQRERRRVSCACANEMTPQCYLGIDLGAESGRVMAGLWDGRRIRLEQVHRFPNGPVEVGGSFRWDVLRLWSEIQTGLAMAGRSFGKSIRSVGVDTWGVGFAPLSRD